MKKTILITGAGGGGSNNLIRDLRTVNNEVKIIGSNIDDYQVAKSIADKTYVLPISTNAEDYIKSINKLIDLEKVELVIPNNDRETKVLSDNRERINAKLFLPSKKAVNVCQDKWEFYKILTSHGIAMAETYEIKKLANVRQYFEKLNYSEIKWVRLKEGSGSKGATKVNSVEQAEFWIKYWNEMRNIPIEDFTISEFLPGRDLAVQSTWKDGELKLMKIAERLSYYGGDARPSGMSSTPQLASTLYDKNVLELCQKVARIVEAKPNGNFNFDLKQNMNGEWCLTEVNIGRFCMITPIFDLTGKYNMIDTYIKLAFDEHVDIEDPFDIEENKFLIRELDTEPLILSKEEVEMRVSRI